jgi:Ca2+-transporting ATPase
MLREAAVLSAGSLGAYGYGIARYGQGPQAATMAFLSLSMGQLLHALGCRSETRTMFDRERTAPNRYLNAALIGTFALQGIALVVPGLRSLLGIAPIGVLDGLVVGGGALLPLLANEAIKKTGQKRPEPLRISSRSASSDGWTEPTTSEKQESSQTPPVRASLDGGTP